MWALPAATDSGKGHPPTAIGLQGSLNPSVRRAAEVIAQGRLGRLLSARVTATTFGNGPESVSAYEYFDKAAAGAGFMAIAVGHVLDVVETTSATSPRSTRARSSSGPR
ncbi:hypothetical protein [Promicromonospora kroppenstedtii]|uniref:hypothetical protein n=1 Tax=Promicromonospora kroppenstedtii TaxID=440482 RepID=UPI0004BC3C12|nr:hypothetical protein [Promicromonospora kroppenstedtii]